MTDQIVLTEARRVAELEEKRQELKNKLMTIERDYMSIHETTSNELHAIESDERDAVKRLASVVDRYVKSLEPTRNEVEHLLIPKKGRIMLAKEFGKIVQRYPNNKELTIKSIRIGVIQWIHQQEYVTQDGIMQFFVSRGFSKATAYQHTRTVMHFIKFTEHWYYNDSTKQYKKPEIILTEETLSKLKHYA
ncbi:MAG: hypothetical protein ACYDG3_10075 [Bacillati bacterium]